MTGVGDGRAFVAPQRVRLGDVTQGGRLRLDAYARYLQDVAADDANEVHLPDDRGWILRRMTCDISRQPTIYEDLEITTRCSGVGGRWAERTTTLSGVDGLNDARTGLQQGVLMTARAIWVYVSVDTGTPRPLPEEFFVAYGDAVRSNKVSARLTHPSPPPDASRTNWTLRSTDFDVFGHVNNACYWVPIEEYLAGPGVGRRIERATIEFGVGVDPGDECHLVVCEDGDELMVWFLVAETVRASIRVGFTSASGRA